MSSEPVSVVFGAAAIGNRDPFIAEDYLNTVFSTLEAHNVKILDTAQLYGEAEKRMGEVKAGNRFTIDTKWTGGWQAGWATKENIVNSAKDSIKKLGVKQVCSRICSHRVLQAECCHGPLTKRQARL